MLPGSILTLCGDIVIMGGFVALREIDYMEGPHVISSHMLLVLSKAPKLNAMHVARILSNMIGCGMAPTRR